MIKPLHDNVILKKEEVENKTSSGIILTTETKKIPSVAKVVAVGPECKAEIKENDKVVYKEYSGTNIEIDEVEYIVISVKDILASIA
ncbi:GroES family chaperonin [Thomasclavelia cocleata]|jgi:chaperonin GroES|uniref:GroES family chaperonin n=1 Tax=Thomasclavelia cocleata TaxID=69824 RepID=UPI00242ABFF9|nr:co-chaperone GroES [Thomasclavelia cocleata]